MLLRTHTPPLALLDLVHLGVALAGGVLRRARRGDDRRVHSAAALAHQSLAAQLGVDPRQDLRGQIVGLQQVPQIENRRLVRNRAR